MRRFITLSLPYSKAFLKNNQVNKIVTSKVIDNFRPETDDSYLCSAFDVEELSGTKEAVHITGSINSSV